MLYVDAESCIQCFYQYPDYRFYTLSAGMDPRGPLPPGVSMMPTQKQRVPPPPGEDNREVLFFFTLTMSIKPVY